MNATPQRRALDLSRMTLEWVNHTDDQLFSAYSRDERYLLYLIFVREFTWEKAADALQMPVAAVKRMYASQGAIMKPPCGFSLNTRTATRFVPGFKMPSFIGYARGFSTQALAPTQWPLT